MTFDVVGGRSMSHVHVHVQSGGSHALVAVGQAAHGLVDRTWMGPVKFDGSIVLGLWAGLGWSVSDCL